MKKISGLFIVYFSTILTISAFSPQLYPPGHWIYDAISALSLEAGKMTMAVNAPLSGYELSIHLESISSDRLSPQGRLLYDRILLEIGRKDPLFSSGRIGIDLRPALTAGVYWRPSIGTLNFESFEDYNRRPTLLSFPLRLDLGSHITGEVDFSIGKGFWSSTKDNLTFSIPLNADSVDLTVPSNAWISGGNNFLTATLGRGALELGRTSTGSMLLSDSSDRLDWAGLAFFSPDIRFSHTTIQLAPRRFAYFHELMLRPRPWLLFRLTEGALVASSFDPRYLNPMMIWHSYAGWRDDYGGADSNNDGRLDRTPVGSLLGLTADLVPYSGIRVYGVFVMNQFQTGYELQNFGDGALIIPNALGGMAGLEIQRPWKDGWLGFTLEGVYANPWLYILSNRDISFYWSRRELVAPSGYASQRINQWLGSPFGPDSVVFQAELRWSIPGARLYGIEYRFLVRGPNGDRFLASPADAQTYPVTVEEAQASTPTGQAVFQNRIQLFARHTFSEQFSAEGRLGWSVLSGLRNSHSPYADLAVTWHIR